MLKILRNSLATQTPAQKRDAYARDAASGAVAYYSDLTTKPLASLNIDMVEFLGGLWRIQQPFEHDIIDVRGKPFVLGRKLDIQEKNRFEYFDAYYVTYNCYGPFIAEKPDFIVGRFSGGHNTLWAYGTNIPAVRSFLAIALFDRYSEMIFAQENMNRIK